MKRIRLDFALMASAALMTASCVNNNEMRLSVPEEITLTGELLRPPVTRTQLDIEPTEDGSLGIMWSPGDKIGVFGKSTKNAEFHGTFTTAVASGLFSGKMTGDNPEFAYYPFVEGATDSKAIPVTVAKVQTYTDATSIAANDVKASDTPVKKADGSHSFVFKPMVSILKTEVTFGSKLAAIGSTEKLQYIIFRQKNTGISAGRSWTGDFTMNLGNLASGLTAVDDKTASEITIKLSNDEDGGVAVGNKAVAFATIAPDIKKGDVIEIELRTNVHKVTFEVKAVADFKAGVCYDVPLSLDNLKEEHNFTVGDLDANPPAFESFKFEIANNEASLLKKTAVLNTSTTKTEVKAAEDFTCDIDKTLNTVSCCIPYLYNFTLAPTFTVAEGVKVYCNGKLQESGVSTQDFKTPVEYTLVSGTQRKVFTVTVTNTGLPVVVVNVNTPGTVTYDGSAIFENLKTYINAIESNLTNGYYTEAYKSLDINSVIDYWFVYEIAMNDEIQHPKSVYMYKDGDGKLSAGPVWDFDSQNFTNVDTEKNQWYYHTWSSLLIERSKSGEGLQYMWWPLLMKDQSYINRVKARWADVYPDLVEIANRVVEDRRKANRLSDYYNRKIWKVGNYLDWHWQCGDEDMEFDKVMDNLKYVYNKRLENLNNTITNLSKWN